MSGTALVLVGALVGGDGDDHLDEQVQDTIAIADELAVAGEPFHLMVTA